MKFSLLFLVLFPISSLFSQNKVLFTGNVSNLCYTSEITNVVVSNQLPDTLNPYNAIFIFSSAQTILTEAALERLIAFLAQGKGIYIGSENWPLQAESNQITDLLFSKQVWGNFSETRAEVAKGSVIFEENDSFPAGCTTVSFPLDYRLQVLAWVNDEPLIQSGDILGGRIILDGGYSRFYCPVYEAENEQILNQLIGYLTRNEH